MAACEFLEADRASGHDAIPGPAAGPVSVFGSHRISKRADGTDRNPPVSGRNEAVL